MDDRIDSLLEAFAILELEIANIRAMPTYTKGEKSSTVDLTFVDPRLSREGSYWQVSDRYTVSDHQALTYQLDLTSSTSNMTRMLKREKWVPATVDRETFLWFLEDHLSKRQQLRQGLKASRVPLQRYAMLRCPQIRIIAVDIQSTGGTRTLRYYVKNAFVLGGTSKSSS